MTDTAALTRMLETSAAGISCRFFSLFSRCVSRAFHFLASHRAGIERMPCEGLPESIAALIGVAGNVGLSANFRAHDYLDLDVIDGNLDQRNNNAKRIRSSVTKGVKTA